MKKDTINIRDVYRSLCENYKYVYSLDTETEKVTVFRTAGYQSQEEAGYVVEIQNYQEYFNKHIGNIVVPEDRENVRRIASIQFLKECLDYNPAYSCEFRYNIMGDIGWMRVKFARIQEKGSSCSIAIGISDVSAEKRLETDFYRESKTVLLVEDNELNLEVLATIIGENYPVLCARDGQEALDIIKEKHEEIALVITDIHMPIMDGYELIRRMKSNREYSSVPIIAATGATDQTAKEDCFSLGAADYFTKPYNPSIINNRVSFMIKYREASNMLKMAEKDALTGLYTKSFFYKMAESVIKENSDKRYGLMVSDIDNFRSYNDRYGVEAGDALLRNLAANGREYVPGYVIGGRIDGDMIVAIFDLAAYEDASYEGLISTFEVMPLPENIDYTIIKNGIYIVDEDISVSAMCDRAKIAVDSLKGAFTMSFAAYDDDMRERYNRRQQIVEAAVMGIQENQFKVYYQPKHDLRSNSTGGAEALVRWEHPDLGFVNPGEFITVFERNGFIRKLDAYVFEQVCRDIVSWMNRGLKVLPVSINLSRRDFENPNLPEELTAHIDECGIDHSLIHFEITESAFVDNMNAVISAVSRLHTNGFIVELDDFGSGYSSMTALNNMSLDVLKIDMSIVKGDVPGSARNALELCVRVGQMLNMKTVAEGVEYREQVERLSELGCDYVQGYYYSKPLPAEDYIKFIS